MAQYRPTASTVDVIKVLVTGTIFWLIFYGVAIVVAFIVKIIFDATGLKTPIPDMLVVLPGMIIAVPVSSIGRNAIILSMNARLPERWHLEKDDDGVGCFFALLFWCLVFAFFAWLFPGLL